MTENPKLDEKTRHYHEDERWETGQQIRDWLLLLLMMAVTVAWSLIVYFNEPGLR